MDPRRLLTLAGCGLALGACATGLGRSAADRSATPEVAGRPLASAAPPRPAAVMAPIPNPPDRRSRIGRAVAAQARPAAIGASAPRRSRASADAQRPAAVTAAPPPSGPAAIAAANRRARETSRADAFVGGVQVFAYEPGRVYEVWTAPLRVTTLTLGPGETVLSKAAGDTVRWQIGETASGEGAARRAHVVIKPLERGLETNLVLATSQRVYLVQLRSGPPETFNAAVAWDGGAVLSPAAADLLAGRAAPTAILAAPAGSLDARYRIAPWGRRPAWTPTAVMTDGVRTFLAFPPDAAAREAPVLLMRGTDGAVQVVNYRQQAGLWIVDRVIDDAELRLGGKRPQVVRIAREAPARETAHD